MAGQGVGAITQQHVYLEQFFNSPFYIMLGKEIKPAANIVNESANPFSQRICQMITQATNLLSGGTVQFNKCSRSKL